MKRWLTGSFGLILAVCLVTGCNRQCFLSKDQFDQANTSLLPPSMELDRSVGSEPLTALTKAPPTVLAPDRMPRYLSLQEAIAIALENGTASTQTLAGATGPGTGTYNTTMISSPAQFGNSTVGLTAQSDYVKVISLSPAIAGADQEAALSRFDVDWITSMNWTVTDNLLQGLNSFSNGESAAFATSFVKQLASGGFVSTSFQQNYQLLTQPPTGTFNILNPLYTSQVTLGFEQPLWRNFGDHINQLLPGGTTPITGFGVPPTLLNQYAQRQSGPLSAGQFGSSDGILIARLRFDQNRADFERVMQGLVLQVEVAYWNLYNAYGQLYSYEESLRIAHRAWMIAHAQLVAGKITNIEYSPVRGQYEDFRTQRAQALGLVLDNERNLRAIVGLPPEDGCRVIPVTPPTLAHLEPDWCASQDDALRLRPELVLARDNLRLAQYNLEVAENYLKPDLRFGAQYVPLGFGTTLAGGGTLLDATGGSQPSNALRSLASNHFNNWTVGLTMNVPLGFRLENATVRAAKLALAQNYYLVKDQEHRATSVLQQQYQKLQEFYKVIETTRAARKNYADAVDARFKTIIAGKLLPDVAFLDFQAKLATAQVAEYNAIAQYNSTLARFEYTKGTVLRYNNVHIAEGQLPQCAQIRAVEHEKERSQALVLRERPDPLTHPGRLAHTNDIPPMDTPRPLPIFDQPAVPLGTPVPADKSEVLPLPLPVAPPAKGPGQAHVPHLQGVTPVEARQIVPVPFTPAEPVFKATPPAVNPQPTLSLSPATTTLIPELTGRPATTVPVIVPVPELAVTPSSPPMAPNDPR